MDNLGLEEDKYVIQILELAKGDLQQIVERKLEVM